VNVLASFIIIAAIVLLMVKVRDIKFNSLPCAFCGRHGKHDIMCPGRR
jgi:hypothetical protein